MHPIATMIDLETLSLRTDAHILQVGVVRMNLVTGQCMTDAFGISDQKGRHIDLETVKWWNQQDPEVARGVFNAPGITTADAWGRLSEMTAESDVWANPSTYDLVVLKDLFGGKTPWSHRRGFCLKTAAAVIDPDGRLKPADNSKAHDALADAMWQLQYLRALYGAAKGVTQPAAS